jgi:O-methyltransferase
MRIGSAANRLLARLGLKITSVKQVEKQFPVEISASDQKAFRYVRDNNLSTSSDERLFATIMACRYVAEQDIQGDFVECGVWRGGNSIIAADVFKNLASHRRVWLFDTFVGMTAPTAADVNIRGETADEKFAHSERGDHNEWCYAPLEEVQGNFSKVGLLTDRVKFVKGDVAKTLSGSAEMPGEISVLRLDTDWYESTKAELEILYPKLTMGGVLIIDDYGHWGGSRKAVDEYFANRGRPFLQYVDQSARIGIKTS